MNVKEALLVNQRAQRATRGAWSCTELLQNNRENTVCRYRRRLEEQGKLSRG